MEKTRRSERWEPAKAVGWYDPGQLFQTGIKIASSSLFAENADGRLVQPLFDKDPQPFDETNAGERASLTLDYIADGGDAFDSTYAVLYHATSRLDAAGTTLEPGQVLVLGGDQVYPTASDEAYEQRLVRPLRIASANMTGAQPPSLYAIPGNHDWYDNLVAFRRLFVAQHRIGGFRAKQRRSYFVLKLPHGFWLFAPDVQLGSELDIIQYEYLKEQANKLPADARVILCTAEPHWVYDNERRQSRSEEPQRSKLLLELERAIDGATGRIRCVLAGDLHHYRRHTGRVGNKLRDVQLITAGGGGAFLHPTHGWRDGSEARYGGSPEYRFQKAYPTPAVSRRMTWQLALGFAWKNPWFLLSSAITYGLVSLHIVLGARLQCLAALDLCEEAPLDVVASPTVVILVFFICAGFVAFTDTSSRAYRWVAGLLHGVVHSALAVAIPVATIDRLGSAFFGSARTVLTDCWLVLATLVVDVTAGALLGGLVMGLYLLISLNGFGRHRNEAFSGLRSPRFKNFLRIVISAEGARIYAFGLDSPPTAWQPRPEDAFEEDDASATGSVASRVVRLEPATPAPAPVLIESILLE